MEKYITAAKKVIAQRFDPNQVRVYASLTGNDLVTNIISENDNTGGIVVIRLPIIDGKYELYSSHGDIDISIDNIDVFEILYDEILTYRVIPQLIHQYKRGYFKECPKGCPNEDNPIDLTLLTPANFKKAFSDATTDVMNGETAEAVKIKNTDNGLEITFTINRGRYGIFRDNKVKLNNRNYYYANFCEALSGCGVEEELQKNISKIIAVPK